VSASTQGYEQNMWLSLKLVAVAEGSLHLSTHLLHCRTLCIWPAKRQGSQRGGLQSAHSFHRRSNLAAGEAKHAKNTCANIALPASPITTWASWFRELNRSRAHTYQCRHYAANTRGARQIERARMQVMSLKRWPCWVFLLGSFPRFCKVWHVREGIRSVVVGRIVGKGYRPHVICGPYNWVATAWL
jgi:hypothetical protein